MTMKEKVLEENHKMDNRFKEIENLSYEFLDRDVFASLLEQMLSVFIQRYAFIEELAEKYQDTEHEEEATKKMNEILSRNEELFIKWKDFFIKNKTTLKQKS